MLELNGMLNTAGRSRCCCLCQHIKMVLLRGHSLLKGMWIVSQPSVQADVLFLQPCFGKVTKKEQVSSDPWCRWMIRTLHNFFNTKICTLLASDYYYKSSTCLYFRSWDQWFLNLKLLAIRFCCNRKSTKWLITSTEITKQTPHLNEFYHGAIHPT